MSDLVSLADIEAAAFRLAGVAVRTPLVVYPGSDLLLKPESLQPVGSFKLRGAYSAMTVRSERPPGVVAHSSGNHAQAVAYAAKKLGIKAILVIPHTAPTVKIDACVDLGAEIVLVEPDLQVRVETADRLAAAHGYDLIPPFNSREVIAGQGTIGLEILADAPEADVILVPVSGGGLIAGIATAIKSIRPEAKVIGVEPSLAADARDSFLLGRPLAWDPADTNRTMADALRVQQVGEIPFAHIREYVDDIVTVTEEEIHDSMRLIAAKTHLIAEPGGAAATAAYLFHADELPGAKTYVSILSGGNVDPGLLFG
ncbi:MAG: threonine/serine dehydratase [Streptosporangiaceae bacterium]